MIATVVQMRAAGARPSCSLPFFVWAQLITALLLLLAFPALQAAAILQLMDRMAGTSFFLPSGLFVAGAPLQGPSGGGNPLLWQHLFWFLGSPGGLRVDPAGARHRRGGDRDQHAAAALGIPRDGRRRRSSSGVMSLIVWAHHMFLTGMGTQIEHVLPDRRR